MSEAEGRSLIARALRGDRDAFGALATRHRDAIYSFAFRMLGDREQAYDAAQETFIRAYTRLDTFDRSRSFEPWLFAIATNTCTDLLRRRQTSTLSLDDGWGLDVAAGDESAPAEALARMDLQRTVAAALQQLSDDQRMAVVLKHLQGFSYEEISEMTGMPTGTVKSHAHRGRRRLAELLGHLEMEDAP